MPTPAASNPKHPWRRLLRVCQDCNRTFDVQGRELHCPACRRERILRATPPIRLSVDREEPR